MENKNTNRTQWDRKKRWEIEIKVEKITQLHLIVRFNANAFDVVFYMFFFSFCLPLQQRIVDLKAWDFSISIELNWISSQSKLVRSKNHDYLWKLTLFYEKRDKNWWFLLSDDLICSIKHETPHWLEEIWLNCGEGYFRSISLLNVLIESISFFFINWTMNWWWFVYVFGDLS